MLNENSGMRSLIRGRCRWTESSRLGLPSLSIMTGTAVWPLWSSDWTELTMNKRRSLVPQGGVAAICCRHQWCHKTDSEPLTPARRQLLPLPHMGRKKVHLPFLCSENIISYEGRSCKKYSLMISWQLVLKTFFKVNTIQFIFSTCFILVRVQ